ncbi:MAG: valine--tRNA ligase [Myxococcales bacterium]|nr:valine--tRNA ligase [Myxococcales bacterium]
MTTDNPSTSDLPTTQAPELDKVYDPTSVEPKWYRSWTDAGCFAAKDDSTDPPYTISMPPPNVTGSLHMGHALTATLEDIMIRWRRMQGMNALWMPGTDHAGIATQMVVERELAKEGKSRHDLGRDAFIDVVWQWKAKCHARITMQHQRLGISCDWERERFTMDQGLSDAVREVFVRLYEEGLIYRAERLINWSPKMQTVLSDLEVEAEEVDGHIWHIAYPVTGSDERLVVATTRPETLLGDTAVAVHPDDPRYQHLIGRTIDLPLTGRQIPVIADGILVDMAFGTGCVKVTPAHDFNDFETGKRHGLPMITVLDWNAHLNQNAPEAYRGLERYEGRKRVIADLDALGLLVKVEPHKMALGKSQRTGEVVEPMLSMQWYVRAEPLAKPAIDAVESGRIEIVPEGWTKTYYHWMYNIRDWCISRQLWWGHRIPAWYCKDCGATTVSRTDVTACSGCASTSLRQDEDVLDTWFSSALWPFSTLGWPQKTQALETFYPNAVMETGHDILFFWVARMIMMGMKFMGEVPFKKVYLHAMVRDEKGEKMSKTKGNVIDPLDIVDTHGADALRFTLAALTVAGRSIKLSIDRVNGYRNFVNKIWNASRFALMNLGDFDPRAPAPASGDFTLPDRWILTRLAETTDRVNAELEGFDFGGAAGTVYQFFWKELCDWYIELAKVGLDAEKAAASDEGRRTRHATQWTLSTVLDGALRLLHPMMPHVTEEIWQRIPRANSAGRRQGPTPFLATADFAIAGLSRFDADAARMNSVISVIEGVRTIRGENSIAPKQPLDVVLSVDAAASVEAAWLEAERALLTKLGGIGSLTIEVRSGEAVERQGAAVARAGAVEISVPLTGLVDFDKERKRLQAAISKLEQEMARIRGKLENPSFVERAPADVVVKEREKLEQLAAEKATAELGLSRLGTK